MMANPRHRAVETHSERGRPAFEQGHAPDSLSAAFGTHVFGKEVMQRMLPADVFENVERAMAGLEQIRPENADPIAEAMKEWAISHGVTHYTHWFLPLTGASAEKHDSFIEWDTPHGGIIEKFGGDQLLQGEPDASSFPSGQLRTTFEARGYTGWDPSSPAFIWSAGDGVTLFIPSVFFSWTGEVLDHKIPLHRSNQKIESAALRLLNLTGTQATHVFATLGLEQEYFVIDRALRNLRPDLVLLGKTVYGAASPKGQELQDHYFGSVKDRILRYMRDFEMTAVQLGIPVKTRHNEVAPAQHEIATVYEEATIAVDHNIVLMELMRQLAVKHDLSCLLHEKPFGGLNGSGKHTNWSLATDTGINLLQPSDAPEDRLRFLIILTAILSGVHRHGGLLRAGIGSAGNDCRLGGHEAPPAIISVYLGDELERLLCELEEEGTHRDTEEKSSYDLGIPVIPSLTRDNTDRNRTSPFAFTGAKFEFRAVGSSANTAEPATILNAIVAEGLEEILDDIDEALGGAASADTAALAKAALPVIKKHLKLSKPVRFSGDNYSDEWREEAAKRKLPNIRRAAEAFAVYDTPTTVKLFEGILTQQELSSRQYILSEAYSNNLDIEAKLMEEIFRTMIVPAAVKYQQLVGESIAAAKQAGVATIERQTAMLKELSGALEHAFAACDTLSLAREAAATGDEPARALAYSNSVVEACDALRDTVDHLEAMVDDDLWPLPKYRELLFFV